MRFPKNRMKFTKNYQGKDEPEGWLVLEVAGVDLDGVAKIYLSLSEVEAVKKRGDVATDRLNAAKSLLGGIGEDTD